MFTPPLQVCLRYKKLPPWAIQQKKTYECYTYCITQSVPRKVLPPGWITYLSSLPGYFHGSIIDIQALGNNFPVRASLSRKVNGYLVTLRPDLDLSQKSRSRGSSPKIIHCPPVSFQTRRLRSQRYKVFPSPTLNGLTRIREARAL